MKKHYMIIQGEYDDKKRFSWKESIIEGFVAVDTVFGIRREMLPLDSILDDEKFGWRITHIPTGFLLVSTYFETFEGAEKFANITTKLFGDLLNTDKITLFKDVRTDKEEYHQFYVLKEKLNNVEGIFSIKDLGKL